ncbi:50S ribosomal protein L3 [Candidatus Peregrinibacteria bacterium CG11_big_fil_rev_8_21_14_0_20_46_8]|nr:MAG: 50S ribosomal protein L3 [Candidatus Peregrinibacteria bacterium CG11_big_fil_rev_8_21_14_0_20_46_8]
MPGIVGRKAGMTRMYLEDGQAVPVTLISCPPSKITQVKTAEKDGYQAVVLGFEPLKKPKKTKKFRVLREFPLDDGQEYKVDDEVTVETFKEMAKVKITGISKGKGFAGTIKRHNFRSGRASHGSHFHREPGSIGACAKPGRVHKGKKMAGHMGHDQVTRRDIPLMHIDAEKHIIAVKGPVPGPNGALVIIKA